MQICAPRLALKKRLKIMALFSGTIYVRIHDVSTCRSKMAAYQDVVAPHQDWPVSSIFSTKVSFIFLV